MSLVRYMTQSQYQVYINNYLWKYYYSRVTKIMHTLRNLMECCSQFIHPVCSTFIQQSSSIKIIEFSWLQVYYKNASRSSNFQWLTETSRSQLGITRTKKLLALLKLQIFIYTIKKLKTLNFWSSLI